MEETLLSLFIVFVTHINTFILMNLKKRFLKIHNVARITN